MLRKTYTNTVDTSRFEHCDAGGKGLGLGLGVGGARCVTQGVSVVGSQGVCGDKYEATNWWATHEWPANRWPPEMLSKPEENRYV